MPFAQKRPAKKKPQSKRDVSPEIKGLPSRLKQARARADFGSAELDALADVAQGTTSRLESGKRLADIETMFQLCRALQVSVHWMATGEGQMHAEYAPRLKRIPA